MKIDYELAEKIGATHWHTGSFDFYKEDYGELLAYSGGNWRPSLITPANAMLLLKPIQKPRTRAEYEKVSFVSVGDCVQSVHDNYGEYFFLNNRSGEYQAAEYQDSAWYWKEGNLYRKVQKLVDWQDEVVRFLNDGNIGVDGRLPPLVIKEMKEIDWGCFRESDFHELCRVTLRALGEID